MLDWRPAPRRAEGPMSTPRRLWPRSMGTPMMRTFCAIFLFPSRRLRVYPVNHAREGNHLANVLRPANPGYRAFKAQAKTRVRHTAIAPQVQIPLEGFLGQVVFAQALDQQIVIVDALATADDFSVAFGSDHVEGEGEVGALGVGLHVERLDRCGIAMDEHGAVEFVGDESLFVAANIFAELRGIAMLLQDADGFFVGDAGKGRIDVFEFFRVALERFEFARFVFQDGLHDRADESFAELHDLVELDISGFGFEHPEFGEVTAGFRFFGAEGRAERVNFAERHGGRFDVKLPALSQVGFLVVDVVDFEKSRGSFAGRRRKHRSVRQRVALGVHEFAGGADRFGTDAEDGSLARSANPQVAVVEKKIDAMLFKLNGEGRALGNFLHDLDSCYANFVAVGGAGLFADFSGDDDAGFLR